MVDALGSSPRGRGTPRHAEAEVGVLRFIPARAGNACGRSASTAPSSVHPRAGGERFPGSGPRDDYSGSSPRGRGTPERHGAVHRRHRFIPARAGNALAASAVDGRMAVHPRAGGERACTSAKSRISSGSSPRGRGTPGLPPFPLTAERFIPARAGNAALAGPEARGPQVHPRAGGERLRPLSAPHRRTGSSPRGRGTLEELEPHLGLVRFIPARAGNALAPRSIQAHRPVHPRAGGERIQEQSSRMSRVGSSPRGRGTRLRPRRHRRLRRFIPARAGNALPVSRQHHLHAVHPRAGGERVPAPGGRRVQVGSSPRGRGTRRSALTAPTGARFIPARAGNARGAARRPQGRAVHPRAGGERDDVAPDRVPPNGSSPRGRGTQGARHLRPPLLRFIPARAGNASRSACGPRGYGGSSPRGRGTRMSPPPCRRG